MGIFDRFKRRSEGERQGDAGARAVAALPSTDVASAGAQVADGVRSAEGVPAAGRQGVGGVLGESAQQIGELREQVELWVRPGFLSRADVLEYASDFRDDDQVPLDDEQLRQLVADVWQARLDEQASWPAYTDADRVAAAFAELDANGVVARMNFTCCQNCGVTEIEGERPADRPSIGYVFFHRQDAERLAEEPAQLYLAYGTLDPEQGRVAEQDQAVGEQIRAALLAQDLPVEWDGSSAQRISVGPLTWHRRLMS